MKEIAFSEHVNAVSQIINGISTDPGERFGIVCTLTEIYRYELTKSFVTVTPKSGEQNESNGGNTSPADAGSVPAQ